MIFFKLVLDKIMCNCDDGSHYLNHISSPSFFDTYVGLDPGSRFIEG